MPATALRSGIPALLMIALPASPLSAQVCSMTSAEATGVSLGPRLAADAIGADVRVSELRPVVLGGTFVEQILTDERDGWRIWDVAAAVRLEAGPVLLCPTGGGERARREVPAPLGHGEEHHRATYLGLEVLRPLELGYVTLTPSARPRLVEHSDRYEQIVRGRRILSSTRGDRWVGWLDLGVAARIDRWRLGTGFSYSWDPGSGETGALRGWLAAAVTLAM